MLNQDGGNSGLATPKVSLDIGLTGHRSHHPVFSTNSSAIAQSLVELVAFLDVTARRATGASDNPDPLVRLRSVLADGADLMAV